MRGCGHQRGRKTRQGRVNRYKPYRQDFLIWLYLCFLNTRTIAFPEYSSAMENHFNDFLLWPSGTTCNDLFCTLSSPCVRIPGFRVRTDNRREHHQDHLDENIIMTPHTIEHLPGGGSTDMQNASVRAETAAGLERKGNYGEAARWWRMAAEVTRNPRQQHWHESRASLCERWHSLNAKAAAGAA